MAIVCASVCIQLIFQLKSLYEFLRRYFLLLNSTLQAEISRIFVWKF